MRFRIARRATPAPAESTSLHRIAKEQLAHSFLGKVSSQTKSSSNWKDVGTSSVELALLVSSLESSSRLQVSGYHSQDKKKPWQNLAHRTIAVRFKTTLKNAADVSTAFEKLPSLTHMKPNREKIEAEELVKERLPLTKWGLTPKEKEDFDRVMRLMFDAASILRYDLELGEDAIGKTLKELADWATN